MAAKCGGCDKEISKTASFYECDGCTSKFHLKCDGVSKDDFNARKGSTRL